MDNFLDYNNVSTKTKKMFKNYKPYWNNELTIAWKNMHNNEKIFRRCKATHEIKCQFRRRFLDAQKAFDKLLRKTQRNYNKKIISEIECMQSHNPTDFWDKVNHMGVRKKCCIPERVYKNDLLTSEPVEVKHKWEQAFKSLFNPINNVTSDNSEEFLTHVKRHKYSLELEMDQPGYEQCTFLNDSFSFDKIYKSICKLSSEKAVGIDFIPNEVLKNATVATVLTQYFNLVFSTGCLPTSWLRSIINPTPKGAGKYLYIPTNYMGISLISCVGKLYSAVLNDRLVEYLGLLNLIADKQNGFRKDRSCEDHVFVLDSVVKNRLNNGQSTYVAFVDMAKAFDWVNRDFLLYKLSHW